MKQFCMLLVSLIVLISMVSCGGIKNDPVEISEAVVKYVQKGKIIELKELCAEKCAILVNAMQDACDENSTSDERIKERMKRMIESEYTLKDKSVNDNEAEFSYEGRDKTGATKVMTIKLEKEGEKWYIEDIVY